MWTRRRVWAQGVATVKCRPRCTPMSRVARACSLAAEASGSTRRRLAHAEMRSALFKKVRRSECTHVAERDMRVHAESADAQGTGACAMSFQRAMQPQHHRCFLCFPRGQIWDVSRDRPRGEQQKSDALVVGGDLVGAMYRLRMCFARPSTEPFADRSMSTSILEPSFSHPLLTHALSPCQCGGFPHVPDAPAS